MGLLPPDAYIGMEILLAFVLRTMHAAAKSWAKTYLSVCHMTGSCITTFISGRAYGNLEAEMSGVSLIRMLRL